MDNPLVVLYLEATKESCPLLGKETKQSTFLLCCSASGKQKEGPLKTALPLNLCKTMATDSGKSHFANEMNTAGHSSIVIYFYCAMQTVDDLGMIVVKIVVFL